MKRGLLILYFNYLWTRGVAVNMPACHAGDRRFDPGRVRHFYFLLNYAGVAELADALDLGSSVFDVGVRVPSPAP